MCPGLPAAVAALLALRLEAVRAIDRLAAGRYEGNQRLLAAITTDRRVHAPLGTITRVAAAVGRRAAVAAALGLVGPPAVRAARGLIGEALLGVELLLPSGEHKAVTAVAAGQG